MLVLLHAILDKFNRRPSAVSRLTGSDPDTYQKENSLKQYFYRKLHLLSFLLMYSLLGFY